jgi:ribosomal protein S18 acetylase RimI-like enzyme
VTAAVRIGPLAPAHRARLAAILDATGSFSAAEVEVALELFDETFAARGARAAHSPAPPTGSDYTFLGAFTPEDELVGYACYGPTPGTDRTYDLYWIAVDPASQRAGIGTILLDEVERRLQGQHARLLVIETSSRSDYARTRAFYAGRGYAEPARVSEFYAPGDDRIILTKRFHSPTGRGASSP